MSHSQLREIVPGLLYDVRGLSNELPSHRVTKPEAPLLIPSETLSPSPQGLHVCPADAPMTPNRDKRQVTTGAEVHHVLARCTEDLSRLSGGEQLFTIGTDYRVDRSRSHGGQCTR